MLEAEILHRERTYRADQSDVSTSWCNFILWGRLHLFSPWILLFSNLYSVKTFRRKVITSLLDISSPLPYKLLGRPCIIYNKDALLVIDFLRILAFLPCPPRHSHLLTFSCILQFNIFLHVTSFVDSAQLFSFLSSLHYHPWFLLRPGVSLP